MTEMMTLLSRYLWPQRRPLLALGTLLIMTITLQMAGPLIIRQFIDGALTGEPLERLVPIALLFLAVAALSQALSLVENYVAEGVGQTATNRLRGDLLLHTLRLDPAFHSAHTPGELIERVDGDVATLGNFFSRLLAQLAGNGLLLIAILALLFTVEWRAGLALTLLALLALILLHALRHWSVPRWAAARQASAELFGLIEERLAGTEDIRANGATRYVMHRLAERTRRLRHAEQIAAAFGSSSHGLMMLILALSTATGLAVGMLLFRAGEITLGSVYLIYSYAQLLNLPIEQISRQVQDIQRAGASLHRVMGLLATTPTIVDGPGQLLPEGALPVACENVSFAYTAAEPILRQLSFELPAGTVLGLLGRTGSGKTTLTRLLFRLHDPTSGQIRIGGIEPRQARLIELRGRVGLVTQEIQLFQASLRDNLTLFDRTLADERLVAALTELGLDDWLKSLPAGLDTMLAPGGGLSAGEAQLLAFARVFLGDPGLVILDEASSRLDPLTERRLERAIDRLLRGRTAIIIAHRLATVERADQIMILRDGQIEEFGPRARLAADPTSRFAQLLRADDLQEVLA